MKTLFTPSLCEKIAIAAEKKNLHNLAFRAWNSASGISSGHTRRERYDNHARRVNKEAGTYAHGYLTREEIALITLFDEVKS